MRLLAVQLRRDFGPDDAVGIAEGQIGGTRQFVSAVGCEEFKGASGSETFSIDADSAYYQRADVQAVLYQIKSFHERAFGLLIIHVVARGQTGDNAQYLLLQCQHRLRASAYQFHDAEIALLRHDAAAGTKFLRHREEAVLDR